MDAETPPKDRPRLPLWDHFTDETFRRALEHYDIAKHYLDPYQACGGGRWIQDDIDYIVSEGDTILPAIRELYSLWAELDATGECDVSCSTIDQKVVQAREQAQYLIALIYDREFVCSYERRGQAEFDPRRDPRWQTTVNVGWRGQERMEEFAIRAQDDVGRRLGSSSVTVHNGRGEAEEDGPGQESLLETPHTVTPEQDEQGQTNDKNLPRASKPTSEADTTLLDGPSSPRTPAIRQSPSRGPHHDPNHGPQRGLDRGRRRGFRAGFRGQGLTELDRGRGRGREHGPPHPHMHEPPHGDIHHGPQRSLDDGRRRGSRAGFRGLNKRDCGRGRGHEYEGSHPHSQEPPHGHRQPQPSPIHRDLTPTHHQPSTYTRNLNHNRTPDDRSRSRSPRKNHNSSFLTRTRDDIRPPRGSRRRGAHPILAGRPDESNSSFGARGRSLGFRKADIGRRSEGSQGWARL